MKKTYTITVENKDGKYHMHRICDGFSPIELLGILAFAQKEILQQMSGEIKPDIIKRDVVQEEEKSDVPN